MRPNTKLVLAAAVTILLPQVALAQPTQEDVFRSIQDNVGSEVDMGRMWPILAAVVGVILLLVVISNRRKRVVVPRSLNHHGKLVREVMKSVPLRSAEVKQLKAIAEQTDADRPLASPLTLLLCPSLMAKTIQTKRVKVDRRALASVARKAGLQVKRG